MIQASHLFNRYGNKSPANQPIIDTRRNEYKAKSNHQWIVNASTPDRNKDSNQSKQKSRVLRDPTTYWVASGS